MIVDVKKYLFIGSKIDLDTFFERAQHQGFMEFISITGKKPVELPASAQLLIAAMRILRRQPVKKPYQGEGDVAYALEVSEKILMLHNEIEKFHEEKRLLQAEISRVAPFGDFSMQDIDFIEKEGKRKMQFFCMKTAKSHKTDFPPEVIYITTEYDLDYFITINKEPCSYPGMIEMRIDRPVGELHIHLSFVEDSIHQLEAELKGFAGHIEFLHEALIEELNQYHLISAKKEIATPLNNSLFAVEAWVPQTKAHALFSFVDGMSVHYEQIAIEDSDRIPTYMENKGANRVGEDLVSIYDTPATTDKDPSGWVIWAFALFFAMIVADGGYGLIYLSIAWILKIKFPNLAGQSRRLFKLLLILASSCVVWGILTTSFFGIRFDPNNLIGKASITQYLAKKKASYHIEQKDDVYKFWIKEHPQLVSATDGKQFLQEATKKNGKNIEYQALDDFSDNILLEFSLMIGVIHISLSLLRYLGRNWAALGWVIFMIGGYLYFPYILNATSIIHFMGWISKGNSTVYGLQLLYVGIGSAIVLALIQKRWKGIGEVANLIQIFADVLSYLRLYALGLAGSVMAVTFNGMGETLGFLVGMVVTLLGHGVNILLASMSGVIHGLRLNFLEWYHYSFEGGGRMLNPLRRIKRGASN